MENRDFKGVWIPKEIYLNKDLSWSEKILLIEIDSLDNSEEKGCFASNKYLSEFIGISESSMANMISKLKAQNYIFQVFFDGRNRGLRVHKNMKSDFMKESEISQKNEGSIHKNMNPALIKTLKQTTQKNEHSNTTNNTENKTTIKQDVIYPFDSERFISTWRTWLLYRKEKKINYKGIVSEQSALKALSEFDEDFAISLIERSMGNGWQGLIYENTKKEYEQHKKTGGKELGAAVLELIANRYK